MQAMLAALAFGTRRVLHRQPQLLLAKLPAWHMLKAWRAPGLPVALQGREGGNPLVMLEGREGNPL